jgi:hypothetical protein
MQVTREVVKDLLPVYLAGEASADTKRLVEEYLRRDPALRSEFESPALPEIPPPGELELAALEQTRKLLARRSWLLGLGLALSFLPLSFGFGGGSGPRFLLLGPEPWLATGAVVAGWGLLGGFLWTCRRLSALSLEPRPSGWSRTGWGAAGCAALSAGGLVVESWLGFAPGGSRVVPLAALAGGLFSVWIGERLRQVPPAEQLDRPVSRSRH